MERMLTSNWTFAGLLALAAVLAFPAGLPVVGVIIGALALAAVVSPDILEALDDLDADLACPTQEVDYCRCAGRHTGGAKTDCQHYREGYRDGLRDGLKGAS